MIRCLNLAAELLDSSQVKIDAAQADLISADKWHRHGLKTVQQCSQHEDGYTVAAGMRSRHVCFLYRGGIDAHSPVIDQLHFNANGCKHFRSDDDVANGRNVGQYCGSITQQGRDHGFGSEIFRPQAANLAHDGLPTFDVIGVGMLLRHATLSYSLQGSVVLHIRWKT